MTVAIGLDRAAEAPVARARSFLLRGWVLEAFLLVAFVACEALGTRAMGQPLVYLVAGLTAVLVAAGIGRPAAERRVLALSGLITLLVAIPINRVSGATNVIIVVMAACAVLTVAAVLWSSAVLPRGWILVLSLTVAVAFVTVLSPDEAALFRFAPFLISFLPAFLLFGQAGPEEQQRVVRVVVLLAVAEGLFATVEPFLHLPQLWSASQINHFGIGVTLPNPLLGGIARAQGTLGHPLPLGVLLVVGVALLIRAVEARRSTKLLLAVPLATGLLMSGSRNSVAMALLVVAYFTPVAITIVRWVATSLVLLFAVLLAFASGVLNQAVTSDFEASGSVTHRSGAIDAVSRLVANQDLIHVLFGNGWSSTARLFELGLLQTDGFGVVDNELVLMLAQGGVVALLLLVGLVVMAFIGTTKVYRPPLLAISLTMFVFDVLIWPSSAALVGIVLAAGLQSLDPRARSRQD